MIPMRPCQRLEGYGKVINHLQLQVADWDLDFGVYYSNIGQIRIEPCIEGAFFGMLNIMVSCARISHITIQLSVGTKFLRRRADTA